MVLSCPRSKEQCLKCTAWNDITLAIPKLANPSRNMEKLNASGGLLNNRRSLCSFLSISFLFGHHLFLRWRFCISNERASAPEGSSSSYKGSFAWVISHSITDSNRFACTFLRASFTLPLWESHFNNYCNGWIIKGWYNSLRGCITASCDFCHQLMARHTSLWDKLK